MTQFFFYALTTIIGQDHQTPIMIDEIIERYFILITSSSHLLNNINRTGSPIVICETIKRK